MRRLTTWKSRISVSGLVALVLLLGLASPAFAAKPAHAGGSGGGAPTGNDISWPQCGGSFPSGQAFGIVGVNGGLANEPNPCLGPDSSVSQSELYWAATTSSGTPTQPDASLYVNTADPGNTVGDWPTTTPTGVTDPYGSCANARGNTSQCAWQYGYNMATQDAVWLHDAAAAINDPTTVSTSPDAYPWWLDVETGNTWQSATADNGAGLLMNVADLQGMVAGLQADGAGTTTASPIGVYSTSSQWKAITGLTSSSISSSPLSSGGTLYGLPVWIPGAHSLSGAKSNCSQTPFTGATSVTLTQWFGHPFDGDYACP